MTLSIAPSALVSPEAVLSEGVAIWHFSQVRENSRIGNNSIVGSYVYLDANVKVGSNCKIQNSALIYDSAVIHDGVFIGPGAILTNDKNPRAIQSQGELKGTSNWEKVGVEIFEGASVGAGAICIAPLKIGKWALIGAGSVVTKDVKNYAIVAGVPATQVGWVGPEGFQLDQVSEKIFQCPMSGRVFEVIDSDLFERMLN
jgi:UDP-2-acetamido-3-amino-2,3-dideoxy-glucuronate N-acetyltransferase